MPTTEPGYADDLPTALAASLVHARTGFVPALMADLVEDPDGSWCRWTAVVRCHPEIGTRGGWTKYVGGAGEGPVDVMAGLARMVSGSP